MPIVAYSRRSAQIAGHETQPRGKEGKGKVDLGFGFTHDHVCHPKESVPGVEGETVRASECRIRTGLQSLQLAPGP
jgi:hypothetical protein